MEKTTNKKNPASPAGGASTQLAIEKYAPPPPPDPATGKLIGLDIHPDTYTAVVLTGTTPGNARQVQCRADLSLNQLLEWVGKDFTAHDLFLMEAGANSFTLAGKLRDLGLRALVLESGHVGSHAKKYADNDKMAAARIAKVFLVGDCPCVWQPDETTRERRELLHLYQTAVRDNTAASNAIKGYQLVPLRKALRLPRVNLFIADDVGLGKTIEAGLIASELQLRRRVRDIVVACPPSMILQWKDELENRFDLTFEIFDRAYMEKIRRERGHTVNAWDTFPRFLISHKLLIDETYVAPMRDWLDNLRPGSLLILDEAYHAAPSSSSKYAIDSQITKAIRNLAFRFEHRLFLSATPHNGHSNSFSSLLEILDRERFVRGVKVDGKLRDDVMIRRLKDDLRSIGVPGFSDRRVIQVNLPQDLGFDTLPEDTPELALATLLDRYRTIRLDSMAGFRIHRSLAATSKPRYRFRWRLDHPPCGNSNRNATSRAAMSAPVWPPEINFSITPGFYLFPSDQQQR